MNNITRFSYAPTTVKEIKANIFTHHLRETKITFTEEESLVHEDEFYKVELKGYKLNQIHKDILDIVLYHGGKEFDGKFKDNSFLRTISLYDIQKHLKYKTKNNNKWITNKIHEMQQTLIVLTDKKTKDKWSFSLITGAKWSDKLNTYAVIINPLYFAFFEKAISVDYKKELPKILTIKHGITKTAIRWLLTHKNGININIDKLLDRIGVKGTTRNKNKLRRLLVDELREIGKDFNIELKKMTNDNRKISDITVIYKRLPNVKFYYPE